MYIKVGLVICESMKCTFYCVLAYCDFYSTQNMMCFLILFPDICDLNYRKNLK